MQEAEIKRTFVNTFKKTSGMKKKYFVVLLLLLFGTTMAHEYILLAAKFRLHKGDLLEVHLFVADGFNIQLERPFQKTITKKFELITKDSTIDLNAITPNAAFPVVNRTVGFEGGGLLHMERDYARIALTTPKFLAYLKEDHIENIVTTVDKNKALQKERYTRYIKALVQSGDVYNDTLYKQITGQNFEIVLLQNPYNLHESATFKAQVFFMSKPLTGKIITAQNRIGNKKVITIASRTDGNGICSFKLPRKGEWFLHATHMIACADKQDSDWESFWASYSFEIE